MEETDNKQNDKQKIYSIRCQSLLWKKLKQKWIYCAWLEVYSFISCGYCHKWPQTQWLKTTHIYFLTIHKIRSLKLVSLGWNQGAGRAALPAEAVEKNQFPCLFQLLELHSWHSSALPSSSNFKAHSMASGFSVAVPLFLSCCQISLLWGHVITFRTHLDISQDP